MAIVTTDNKHYSDISNAIREKLNTSDTYTPADMPGAIKSISGGGDIGTGEYCVKVLDYDGSLLDIKYLDDGEEYTLPSPPTNTRMKFTGWSSSAAIVDNKVVVNKNDIMIGAVGVLLNGNTRIEITLTAVTGLNFQLKFNKTDSGTMYIYWGDGAPEKVTKTGSISLSHNYTNTGNYSIDMDFNGRYYFDSFISNNTSSVGNYTITKILISQKVTSIGTDAFRNCRSFTSIVIPDNVISIGSSAFNNCYSLTSIVIPDSITSIGNYAFQNCYSLTSIVIPYSVTLIGNVAFALCCSLSSIVIPNSVTSIGINAFNNCYSLTLIVIPESVTSIESSAFQACYSIKEYIFANSTSIPTLSSTSAFSDISQICKIYVPDNLLTAWKSATTWSTFAKYIYPISERPAPTNP